MVYPWRDRGRFRVHRRLLFVRASALKDVETVSIIAGLLHGPRTIVHVPEGLEKRGVAAGARVYGYARVSGPLFARLSFALSCLLHTNGSALFIIDVEPTFEPPRYLRQLDQLCMPSTLERGLAGQRYLVLDCCVHHAHFQRPHSWPWAVRKK